MRLAAAARATRDVALLALVYVPFLYTVLLQSALTGRPLDTAKWEEELNGRYFLASVLGFVALLVLCAVGPFLPPTGVAPFVALVASLHVCHALTLKYVRSRPELCARPEATRRLRWLKLSPDSALAKPQLRRDPRVAVDPELGFVTVVHNPVSRVCGLSTAGDKHRSSHSSRASAQQAASPAGPSSPGATVDSEVIATTADAAVAPAAARSPRGRPRGRRHTLIDVSALRDRMRGTEQLRTGRASIAGGPGNGFDGGWGVEVVPAVAIPSSHPTAGPMIVEDMQDEGPSPPTSPSPPPGQAGISCACFDCSRFGQLPRRVRNGFAVSSYLLELVLLCALALREDVPWLSGDDGSRVLQRWARQLRLLLLLQAPPGWAAQASNWLSRGVLGVVLAYMVGIGVFIHRRLETSHPAAPLLFDIVSGSFFLPVSNRLLGTIAQGSPGVAQLLLPLGSADPAASPSSALTSACAVAMIFYSSSAIFLSSYRSDELALASDAVLPPVTRVEERAIKAVLSLLTVLLDRHRTLQLGCAAALVLLLLVSLLSHPTCEWRSLARLRACTLGVAAATLAVGAALAALDTSPALVWTGARVIILICWATLAGPPLALAVKLVLDVTVRSRGGWLLYDDRWHEGPPWRRHGKLRLHPRRLRGGEREAVVAVGVAELGDMGSASSVETAVS